MKRKLFRIITAFSLCLTLLLANGGAICSNAATQAELEEQLRLYQLKKDELNRKIDSLRGDKNKETAYRNSIGEKITLINDQLNTMSSRISSLNAQAAALQKDINNKQAEIDKNWDTFKSRLRAIYMSNDTSYIGMVLGEGSYTDMLMKTETLKRISDHDKALIDMLEEDIEKIEENKKTVEESRKSVELMKAEVEVQLKELDEAYKESQLSIDYLAGLEKGYQKSIEQIEAEEAAAQAEIARIIGGSTSTGILNTAAWTWPCPSSRYITSTFGWRTLYGKPSNHTGIDIAAACNADIVAANYGTVVSVVTDYTPGVGYGKYLVIDNGSNYYTLYGHCNSIVVSVGQTVYPGMTIAKVGTTGNSTGYHLHFEVRIKQNGVVYCQNPLNYVSR